MELKINQILQDKGIKLSDLAEKMGVDQSNLKRSLEKNPSLSRLEEVAKALDVNIQDLFPYVPPVMTAGTLQVGDRYYTLVPMEPPQKPYSFTSTQFFRRVEAFILKCINENVTLSFCGLYEDKCPCSLLHDHKSGRLFLSFCPSGENYITTVYEPRSKMLTRYYSASTAANETARIIMGDIDELLYRAQD